MSFKAKDFLKQQFTARTEKVSVPDLADWFEGDAVWTVRGLSASEFARCQEAEAKRSNIGIFCNALQLSAENRADLQKLLGTSGDVPGDIARRLEMLVIASVDPVIDMLVAIRLADAFGVVFYQLTNKILELTGQGKIAEVKQKPSGDPAK